MIVGGRPPRHTAPKFSGVNHFAETRHQNKRKISDNSDIASQPAPESLVGAATFNLPAINLQRKMMRWLVAIWLAAGAFTAEAQPQPLAGQEAWTPIAELEGVAFSYIFYREADNVHGGVVMLLTNTNAYAVRYRFKAVFRSGADEVVAPAEGILEPGASKTGDAHGLFWIPFKDDREIEQVGLRGYAIRRVGDG